MCRGAVTLWVFITITASVVSAAAQDEIRLVDPATMEARTIGGKTIHRIYGDVHWFNPQRNLHIYCDTTDFYQNEKRYVLIGHVSIVDPEKVLVSERVVYQQELDQAFSPGPFTLWKKDEQQKVSAATGSYYYSEKRLFADGNVVYADSQRCVYADEVEYFERDERVVARGNVRIEEFERETVATAQYAEYLRRRDYGIIQIDPRVAVADTAGKDSLIVTGMTMEYFGGDSARFVVTDSTRITKGSITAESKIAVYDRLASRVYLRENPRIFQENTEIYAQKIDLIIEDESLTEVVATDSALVLTPADSTGQYDLTNLLAGKTINIFLNDGSISRIVATRNAACTYYYFTENDVDARHRMTAEQIVLEFVNGALIRLKSSQDEANLVPKRMINEIKKH